MSRGWAHSDLIVGEDVVLPDEFFEVPKVARARMLYCRYIGETDTGIMIEIQYKPSLGESLEHFRVVKFIQFAAIWCGDVKVYRLADRTTITAERKNPLDMSVHNGYRWHEVEKNDL